MVMNTFLKGLFIVNLGSLKIRRHSLLEKCPLFIVSFRLRLMMMEVDVDLL